MVEKHDGDFESGNQNSRNIRNDFPDNLAIISEIGFRDFFQDLTDFEQEAFQGLEIPALLEFFYQIGLAQSYFETCKKIIQLGKYYEVPLSLEAKVHEEVPECPEFIYFNLPEQFLPLFLTYPGEGLKDIPENPSYEPGKQASLKIRNTNKFEAGKPITSQILEIDDFGITHEFLAPGLFRFLRNNGDVMKKLDISVFWPVLEQVVKYNTHEHAEACLGYIKKRDTGTELGIVDFDAEMGAIAGIYFRGKYYEGEAIEELKTQYESDTKDFWALTNLQKGDYLYRAPRLQEWDEIIKNKGFICVRNETNFESGVDSQVQMYSQTEGYAGKVIRIKLEGPYVRNAGMQVPRLTSFTAFYAKVEVLDGDEWKSFEDYEG